MTLMYQMLDSDSWSIDPSCKKLIEVLPQLSRDTETIGDCIKFDGDDPGDTARYALKSYLPSGGKPERVQVIEAVAAAVEKYPDMTTNDRYMLAEMTESKLHKAQDFGRGSRFAHLRRHR
jgi:hypothetical protein